MAFKETDIQIFTYPGDVKQVAQFMLSKEQYILDTYPFVSDYNVFTNNHVTTRSSAYSVFHFIDECPELQNLLNFIQSSYYTYAESIGLKQQINKPAINCWLNIIKQGERINFHKHSNNEDSFICGTLYLQVNDTQTTFLKQNQIVKITNNVDGEICFFRCDLDHGTNIHQDSEPRVTFGFEVFFDSDTVINVPHFYKNLIQFT